MTQKQEFDQAAVENILAQADAEGFYNEAAPDWQPQLPDGGKLVATVVDAGLSVRTDRDTGIQYVNMKPKLRAEEGTDKDGQDLAGKEFPLNRFGFNSHNVNNASEMGARQNMEYASVLAGEPVTAPLACRDIWVQAAATATVVEVTAKRGVAKGSGKPWYDLRITGVIETTEAPASE